MRPPAQTAGLAHLWFVTIHPFDDGNGRIARAIADMALARSENSPQRFYSMSAQIRQERNDYYDILERTQKGTLDVTLWMEWFLACLGRAIDGAEITLTSVLKKARFWQANRDVPISDRQRLMLNRLLDGFEGNLTTSKWAGIAKCSPDTALRDILELVERGILTRNPEPAGVPVIHWRRFESERAPAYDYRGALGRGKGSLRRSKRFVRRALDTIAQVSARVKRMIDGAEKAPRQKELSTRFQRLQTHLQARFTGKR